MHIVVGFDTWQPQHMNLFLDQRNTWSFGAWWGGNDVCEELRGPFLYGGHLDFIPGFLPSTMFSPLRKACFGALQKKKSFPAPNLSGRWKKPESFDWSKLSQPRRQKRLFWTFYGLLGQSEYAPREGGFLMFYHGVHLRSKLLRMMGFRVFGQPPKIWVKIFDFCCAHGTSCHPNHGLFERINH